jgi:acetolactate synthase-1/2/3 large subunit
VAGTRLQNPDFVALAKAYGYAAVRIQRSDAFESELLAALARPEGTLIEVVLEPELISTRGTLAAITRTAMAR